MEVNSFCRGVLLGFLASLLFAGTFCQADDKIIEVNGKGECADCSEKSIPTSHAFSGLRVTIYCKHKDGKFKQKGDCELDEEGNFKVSLPNFHGDDKEECYAQLHSASSAPCPAYRGLEAAKIVAKFGSDGKQTFEPAEMLKFYTELCTSATLWPHYKYPPVPEIDSWKHHFGHHFKFTPHFKKPENKKPEPPSEPKKPKPSAPERSEPKKPKPSAPEKSEPKKQKPQAPKKSFAPSDPKKEKPPVSKSPSEKSPISKKPFPHFPKISIPDIHKKFFHHPKFPYFPPLPPHFPRVGP